MEAAARGPWRGPFPRILCAWRNSLLGLGRRILATQRWWHTQRWVGRLWECLANPWSSSVQAGDVSTGVALTHLNWTPSPPSPIHS
jgi:hypothetical protein